MSSYYSVTTYLKVFAAGILIAAVGIGAYSYMQEAPASANTGSVDVPDDIAQTAPAMTVYSSPTCGCCGKWVAHLRENGFTVEEVSTNALRQKKAELGVPAQLSSCHTGVIGNYVVEGHVPAEQVKRMLAMKPQARGLTVPGMPIGSPGMEQGDRYDPYNVLAFTSNGSTGVFASYHQDGNR